MTEIAPQVYSIRQGKTKVPGVDVSKQMVDGETLVTVPTVVEVNSSNLTISNPAVNTTALTINGKSVPIGQAITFSVEGNLQGRYLLEAYAVSSEGQDIGGQVRLNIG